MIDHDEHRAQWGLDEAATGFSVFLGGDPWGYGDIEREIERLTKYVYGTGASSPDPSEDLVRTPRCLETPHEAIDNGTRVSECRHCKTRLKFINWQWSEYND